MNYLDYEIKPEAVDELTVEEAEDHDAFVKELNYLVEEGFIELEESEDGEIRAYPTTA